MIYAAMLKIDGWPCVVVGGGRIASRKAAGLIDAGAAVTVIAPHIGNEMRNLAVKMLRVKPFEPADLAGQCSRLCQRVRLLGGDDTGVAFGNEVPCEARAAFDC